MSEETGAYQKENLRAKDQLSSLGGAVGREQEETAEVRGKVQLLEDELRVIPLQVALLNRPPVHSWPLTARGPPNPKLELPTPLLSSLLSC
ncbi:hypothetical protein P7K49_024892, partial [Saguinus oedipus]